MKKKDYKKRKKLFKAITKIRDYLNDEYIAYNCIDEPCLGCISCNAHDLDRKLLALRNTISGDYDV